MKSLVLTARHIFLQCSPCGEVDLLDLEARVYLPLLWVLSLSEVGVLDPEANLFFMVHSFGKIVVFDS